MKHILALAFFLACLMPQALVADDDLRANQPYSAKQGTPVDTEIVFTAAVTAPHGTKRLRVWMPLPPSDNAQQCESLSFSTFPTAVDPEIGAESRYGNRFAYFEFIEPKGAQLITHRLRVKTRELVWNIDPAAASTPTKWPDEFAPYLEADTAIALGEDGESLLQDIVAPQQAAAEPKNANLTRAMDWIEQNLQYDHANASLAASAEHALRERAGHCSDYHGLCAAFGRELGFPTRVTYGLALFPKDSPSHCKLEVYLPPNGWVSYDLSETQKMLSAISANGELTEKERKTYAEAARRRLHRGYREAAWLLMTRGTDYDLEPTAEGRVNVVRTLYAEADGVALPEPDPANPHQREFAWMTSHRYDSNRTMPMPFQDLTTLTPFHIDLPPSNESRF
ncbi:transglutaminase-like domain-containing protein [Botrimarina hoheduenensis]|uniref:Transglutaminase-like superfamily protein n=1 Tax=Botrimarina hoheduenensis TaxID=2528000 RepID=A0A5C5VYA0_9BACT|nr:transglutaminase-like domain-containing protein [Botrimarina hoheduenensis]TWT43127.1 Transglutaminase-like superfamily protein [Botrimarina hoheduenensis]